MWSPPSARQSFLLILAGLEWWRWYTAAPPNPMMWTAAAVLAVVFTGWEMIRARKRVLQLRLARDGERAVGQFLEGLREDGFRIFHDVRGEQFNVDHVLVGPKGVFTVETKTCSKPAKGKAVIEYDGKCVTVNGFKPERDPITQARAQASWLQDLIRESTGRSVEIPCCRLPGLVRKLTQRRGTAGCVGPQSKGAAEVSGERARQTYRRGRPLSGVPPIEVYPGEGGGDALGSAIGFAQH
jgi:hypothetical protein